MYRFITEWMETNQLWVTDQPTFERAVRAIGLELEGRGVVNELFTQAVLEQEQTIPSGVADVAVPVAVIDVPRYVTRKDGIALLHLNHPFDVVSITGEPVRAEMLFFVTAITEARREAFHKLMDDLLMNDEALQALAHIKSRSGLYHLQTMDLKAFSS